MCAASRYRLGGDIYIFNILSYVSIKRLVKFWILIKKVEPSQAQCVAMIKPN